MAGIKNVEETVEEQAAKPRLGDRVGAAINGAVDAVKSKKQLLVGVAIGGATALAGAAAAGFLHLRDTAYTEAQIASDAAIGLMEAGEAAIDGGYFDEKEVIDTLPVEEGPEA